MAKIFRVTVCDPEVLLSFEVFHGGLEHPQVVIAGNVLIKAGADALTVAHLAEDPAVRRGDALDGVQGIVGVEMHVAGGIALQIHILGGDLAVLRQLPNQGFFCQEPALAVGNGHIVHLPHAGQCQPGGLIGGDTGADDAALVPGDGVEGQRGGNAHRCR